MLPNGHYKTEHGSEMWISGKHGGISRVEFDWLEEPNACCECQVEAYERDGCMHWTCNVCGGGFAELQPVPPNTQVNRTEPEG